MPILRVMTFNIHAGVGDDGVYDLERIARVIENQGVDVVALQEVDEHFEARTNFVDQAPWLGRRLGMYSFFGANQDFPPLKSGQPRRRYGIATLTRAPILNFRHALLPSTPTLEQRGSTHVLIETMGRPVHIFNTHLQHNSQQDRIAQAAQLCRMAGKVDHDTVICGDFNAGPDQPELTELAKEFTDVWARTSTEPGYTYNVKNPRYRIDYVFTSAGIKPGKAEVIYTDASDHFPLVVELDLR